MQARAIFQEGRMPTDGRSVVWKVLRGELCPPHFHGQLELLLVRRGTAQLRLGNQEFALRADTLAVILPGITHFTYELSPDFDMWVLGFEPEHVKRVVPGVRTNTGSSPFAGWLLPLARSLNERPCLSLAQEEAQQLSDVCGNAHSRQLDGEAPACLDQVLLAALGFATRASRDGGRAPLAFRAGCLVAENTMMGRDELCDALSVSPSYLARHFREELGTGFAEYRSRVRISSFLAFARDGQTLLQSGLAAGFGSYSQLYRTFNQVTAWKPREYLLDDGRAKSSGIIL